VFLLKLVCTVLYYFEDPIGVVQGEVMIVRRRLSIGLAIFAIAYFKLENGRQFLAIFLKKSS